MTEDDAAASAEADPAEQDTEETGDAASGEETDSLTARVTAHDEELGAEVAALRERAETAEAQAAELESEVESLTERLQRTQADFQNYKKRAERREEEIRERATEDLVERLLDVRDNLSRALEQDEDSDIRDGVEATLRSFDRVLEEENVEAIEPDPGSEVDPARHEVMLRTESDQPADTVAELYRPGYEMGGRVLRAAQVTVSGGEE